MTSFVNILATDQHHLCAQLAARTADKFDSVHWRPASNDVPLIEGAVASIEASVQFELLFYRGGYGGFA